MYSVFQGLNKEEPLTSKALIELLEENGWVWLRTKGSHHQFKKDGFEFVITVPHPSKDVKVGTLNKILKQAGLK